jgi:DNA-binding NtrC family response regulator
MNAKPLQVWLVDDDASIRWVLEKALKGSGMIARCFDGADNALTALRGDAPDVLMTDIRMPGRSGLPVIVMTAHSDLDAAVAAYQGGAFEYLPKPFDIDKAVDLVRRAAQQATVSTDVEATRRSIPELLGQAAAMQQVFRAVGRLSRSSMTVLITGESGTGKELVARALHRHSPRSSKAFVALNTAAFTADLLESELFGHEKGAFTGADALRRGRFEQAAARCFSMRSGTCHPHCRHGCCESWPRRSFTASAARRRSRSTCGSSRRLIRTSKRGSSPCIFARICCIGSTSSASRFRRFASVARTSRSCCATI